MPIAIFQIFSKKDFSENPVNLDMGGQLKLNFNFDDIRTNFLEILTCYSFSVLLHFHNPLRVRVRVTVNVKPRVFTMNHQKQKGGGGRDTKVN